jgi:hypothetical protein
VEKLFLKKIVKKVVEKGGSREWPFPENILKKYSEYSLGFFCTNAGSPKNYGELLIMVFLMAPRFSYLPREDNSGS